MNLVVDIGNSFLKAAVFTDNGLVEARHFATGFNLAIKVLLEDYPGISHCIICETGKSDLVLKKEMKDLLPFVLELEAKTPIPLENLYKTKDTLGKDRIAGAVGANEQFPGTSTLIIDTGTAITFDFVNNKNQFIGGSISPGLNMRYQALHEFTDKLPLLSPTEAGFRIPANHTTGAIHAGIISGILHETEGVINDYKHLYPSLKVILTGGDALFFEKMLKSSIFVDLNLVVRGLNKILKFNA